MSVKASVSISDQQDAFARDLVADGQYASLSAVVQRGLELLRAEKEREAAELAALRGFFAQHQIEDLDATRPLVGDEQAAPRVPREGRRVEHASRPGGGALGGSRSQAVNPNLSRAFPCGVSPATR